MARLAAAIREAAGFHRAAKIEIDFLNAAAFIFYGLVLGLAVFVWYFIARLLAPMFNAKPAGAKAAK